MLCDSGAHCVSGSTWHLTGETLRYDEGSGARVSQMSGRCRQCCSMLRHG